MLILLSPNNNPDKKIEYSFSGEKITATFNGKTDEFDFTNFPDGELSPCNDDGTPTIITCLDVNPIVSAKRENGVLSVEILNFINDDATQEERFPNWKEV